MENVSRRSFLGGMGAASLSPLATFQYANAQTAAPEEEYKGFEDLYRQKWTWDKVSHGTHGTNCTGNCAFNVYVKNGVVWREEQRARIECAA